MTSSNLTKATSLGNNVGPKVKVKSRDIASTIALVTSLPGKERKKPKVGSGKSSVDGKGGALQWATPYSDVNAKSLATATDVRNSAPRIDVTAPDNLPVSLRNRTASGSDMTRGSRKPRGTAARVLSDGDTGRAQISERDVIEFMNRSVTSSAPRTPPSAHQQNGDVSYMYVTSKLF